MTSSVDPAWYMQTNPPDPAFPPRLRTPVESGESSVPTTALPEEPFFKRFQADESGGFYPGYQGSRLHAPIGNTSADDEARKLVTVAKSLGEALPALSYAQGSNAASAFTRPGMSGNFDLNTSEFKNGWPTSRPNQNWLHSDCLNVAYIFHYKFYDRMVNDGGLK